MASNNNNGNNNNNDVGMNISRGFGWVPDTPDIRDNYYQLTTPLEEIPPHVDLREKESMKFPLFDQGQLGSCVGNSTSAAIAYAYYVQTMTQATKDANIKQGQFVTNPFFIASRLFIYYNARAIEGSISSDSGCMIRDAIKSINKLGVCKEIPTWPYDIYKFAAKPPSKAYNEAGLHQALQYRRLDNTDINQLKACLASGFPFIFGFTVYKSFMSAQVGRTGMVPMPTKGEPVMGGHAVLAVGYDDVMERFLVRNSWGDHWGDKGYFYIPYAYLTNRNLADDFWTITMMEV